MLKSGACETSSVTWVDCVVPPPVPTTVKVIVPDAALGVVMMFSVDEKGGVPDGGLNDADTSGGAFVTLKLTICGLPETGFTVTV